MATQTKERTETVIEPAERSANGAQTRPASGSRTAWDDLKHNFGKYKDDPYAQEVLKDVVASRRRDRIDDDAAN
jgi:hypothetical protein